MIRANTGMPKAKEMRAHWNITNNYVPYFVPLPTGSPSPPHQRRDRRMSESKDWEDTELIECAKCGKALNGLSLWIVGQTNPETYCEDCYNKRPREDLNEKS
jgi:hypothetical protein